MSDNLNPSGSQAAPAYTPPEPLKGLALVLGTLCLSLATFMNVLDSSIANVSIPGISGDLGVSPSQGTWVITSFGVANAISVPLTGWLTQRFGAVRLFNLSIVLFVLASILCGLAPSIEWLVAFRVLQGLVAGPMIPLSQTLLMSSYPKSRAGTALALWGMTTLVAPVVGPLLGGWITDNFSWPWIFYINAPVGVVAALLTWVIYKKRETPIRKLPIDSIGLTLLVLWVGSLQLMLDKGKELDWFASSTIVILAVVAAISFAVFLVWEFTDDHPVVDLRLFLGKNFFFGCLSLSLAYGIFFGNNVILPLWLQQWMGYTATSAGIALAPVGALAILLTPLVGKKLNVWDPRLMASGAFLFFFRGALDARLFHHRDGFGLHLDPHHFARCCPRLFLHSIDHGVPRRAGPGAHPCCSGFVQLCQDHRRRHGDVHCHHHLGPARRLAPCSLHRALDTRSRGIWRFYCWHESSGSEHRASLGANQPHDRSASLHPRSR